MALYAHIHCRYWSTLAQAMACCLTASRHYPSQCWPIIKGSNVTGSAQEEHFPLYIFGDLIRYMELVDGNDKQHSSAGICFWSNSNKLYTLTGIIHAMVQKCQCGPHINMKTFFSCIYESHYKNNAFFESIIFIMRTPLRWHLYIETAPIPKKPSNIIYDH